MVSAILDYKIKKWHYNQFLRQKMDFEGFASLVDILHFDLLRPWKDNVHNLMCKFSLLPDKAI